MVHLTRVHEVQGTSLFERSYTLYTLQYGLSWLASSSGECDKRYSEFEKFHERVVAQNFRGLDGLAPAELVQHFPEKSLWKNSDEVVAARKSGFQAYLDAMAKHSVGNLQVRELLTGFLTGS